MPSQSSSVFTNVVVLSLLAAATEAQVINIPVQIPMTPEVNSVFYGASLTVEDGNVYVSAVGTQPGAGSGPTGVYKYDIDTLEYLSTFAGTGTNPNNDFFGFSSMYSEGLLLVGAPFTENAIGDDGAVYMFDAGSGALLNTFQENSVFTTRGSFGWNISVNDAVTVVGAPRIDFDGKVFIYDTANYMLSDTLESDPTFNDFRFGSQVTHNDFFIAISAPGDPFFGVEGAVYVYEYKTRNLLRRITSPIPDTLGMGEFGFEIALEGDRLLVASGAGAVSGIADKVAVYDLQTQNLIGYLDGNNSPGYEGFGRSISIESGTVVVGAQGDDRQGPDRGSVQIFDLATRTLTETVFLPDSAADQQFFGWQVTIQDGTILASSGTSLPNLDIEGRVWVFREFCRQDINMDGSINFFDISTLLNSQIDWNDDGMFNFFDIASYINAFNEDCP
ncbi:MAG: hypothetical protein AB8F26_11805 [Phycisphaerales bacterium]